ncbi:uS8 family ribosomal protein [Lacunimicrobium album]|jgi:small subunit ribosomal protein S8
MMTDPIADMLTRIRNGVAVERPFVDMPYSREKKGIAEALQREGYIWDFEVVEQPPQNVLRINLKYGPNGEKVIQHVERVSKPGRRVYTEITKLKQVMQGMGVTILSTNKGILSNREAKAQNVGGEVLCQIY